MTFPTFDTARIYGWRHWGRDSHDNLVSPLKPRPVKWDGPTVYATCPHGNAVPSDACSCGIYFLTHAESLFDDPDAWVDFRKVEVDTPHLLPLVDNLVTLGHSVQATAIAPEKMETWGRIPRRAHRAAGYRVAGILFAGESQRNTQLAERLGVPWRVGLNLTTARKLHADVMEGQP